MPLVSVILNSYNQKQYLSDAVESVLGQTFPDFELIVIDNGSTDGSQDLLEDYQEDVRVRLFLNSDNCAISRRFNQGVQAARGEFVSFLYSDDFYLPEKLQRQVDGFRSLSADYGVVYGPHYSLNQVTGERWRAGCITASGSVLRRMFLDFERGQIDMIAPLTRRECFLKYPFKEEIFAEGEGSLLKVAMTYKFHYLDEPLVVVRDHGANAGKAVRRNTEMHMETLADLRKHPDFLQELLPDLRSYQARIYRNHGWQMVRASGDISWARYALWMAVRISPREALHPRTLAGLCLSFIPPLVRKWLNEWADRVRGLRHTTGRVTDYGGSVERFYG